MSMQPPNPYAAPPGSNLGPQIPQGYYVSTPSTVSQVMVVSIFQIVEGALEILVCLGVFGYAGFFIAAYAGVLPDGPDEDPVAMQVFGVIGLVCLVFGTLILIAAIFRIWAGIAGLRFRRRKMAIFAASLGLVSTLTFYCSFFSIAIFVYGLIIYLDRNVKRAYQMAEEGMSPDEIRNPMSWSTAPMPGKETV